MKSLCLSASAMGFLTRGFFTRGLLMLGLVAATADLLLAQPADSGLMPDPETYGNRYAIIVGNNYTPGPGETGGPEPLRFAEQDAEAFYALLLKNYGFEEKKTKRLIGKQATKANLELALSELKATVKEDDCVLFFFSGHGVERVGDTKKRGQLLCSGTRFLNGQPLDDGVFELNTLVTAFQEDIKARHELLILDCCYSATVFTEYMPSSRPPNILETTPNDKAYSEEGLQAMVASWSGALDGIDGHSPFTGALLKSLERMPPRRAPGAAIRTSELFSQMKAYFADSLGRGQSPSCSWLTSKAGEFHFFPTGDFPNPEIPDHQIRKMMVAMVPGSFGNWWFAETPWFMPGLRYHILEENEELRSNDLQIIASDRLRVAAESLRQRRPDKRDERFNARLDHLTLMLNAEGGGWNSAVKKVIQELTLATQHEQADPLDLHYLAVLHHGSGIGDRKLCANLYQRALAGYQEKIKADDKLMKSLYALCHADLGWYYYDVEAKYEQSCKEFLEARLVYHVETPPPFLIYVFCREADALARLGRFGAARSRLDNALTVVMNADPQLTYPITAAYFHRQAWIDMDWCDFKSAQERFALSNQILDKGAGGKSAESTILRFHNKHGAAMATRFAGNRDEALTMYRQLLNEIAVELRKLRDDVNNDPSFRQVRARMIERWVNTLERIGDCSLFGNPTDLVEAADDYRRAIRAATYLPPELRNRLEQRLRYKYALTLAIPGSPVCDLEMAQSQLDAVAQMLQPPQPAVAAPADPADQATGADWLVALLKRAQANVAAASHNSPHQSLPADIAAKERDIGICRMFTKMLLQYGQLQEELPDKNDSAGMPPRATAPAEFEQSLQHFRSHLQTLLEQDRLNQTLRRDEIEAALFCTRVLMTRLPDPTKAAEERVARFGRTIRRGDVELLLGYCHLTRPRGALSTSQGLAFLRPYYDCALASLLELQPADAKQLIAVAHEARVGSTHFKAEQAEATLVLYCLEHENYLFLDVPRSTSTYYRLSDQIDVNMLQQAAAGALPPFALPLNLQKELARLESGPLKLRVCWQDSLRLDPPVMALVKPVIENAQLITTPVAEKKPRTFPFQLSPKLAVQFDEALDIAAPSTATQPVAVSEGKE